ncbi:MAG: DUF2634 domain-containing protein [Catonella sp.]
MIPESFISDVDLEEEIEPHKTYRMNFKDNNIEGFVDGKDAIRQAIYKILGTERYAYPIYSWDYGIELSDLYGEDVRYVCAELEDRIKEALTQDERVTDVIDFEFDIYKGTIKVRFAAVTDIGKIYMEIEVSY